VRIIFKHYLNLGDLAELETSCRTWNRLLYSLRPGQLAFLLRAASDTLPTAMNLRRWNIQCSVKCILCDSSLPTTAHVLSACPIALSQDRYTYRHDLVLQFLVSSIMGIYCLSMSMLIFPTSEPVSHLHQTIPTNVMVTPFRPDIVVHI